MSVVVDRRDARLARLLQVGSWIAFAVIAIGLVSGYVPALADLSKATIHAGIALFILLPIARLLLLLVLFVRESDRLYAAIAALVLAIIAIGVLVSLHAR
jgi:uncharacterized membrane protein